MKGKSLKGIANIYPILGVLIIGLLGLTVFKVLPRKNINKTIPPSAGQITKQALKGELENKGCTVSLRYPEGWEVTFNNVGTGTYNNDKWDAKCMIGLKSPKVDAPFSLLINDSVPTKTLAEYQQDLLESERRNIGLSKYTQDVQILGNTYTVRFDETQDKGFLTTYFQNDSMIIELYGFYLMNDPSTKAELLQIISSLRSN